MADKRKSLRLTHQDLVKEWDVRRNDSLTPDDVFANSETPVWWCCSAVKSHIWQSPVKDRTIKDERGCPYCWSKRAGLKTLDQFDPSTAKLWHPTKNQPLSPADFFANSDKEVWWLCENNHCWKEKIGKVHRAVKQGWPNKGCPECEGGKAEKWEKSLAEAYPELAQQWHKTKNGQLKATDITPGCGKLVWWKCPKNKQHCYQMTVHNRVFLRGGCSYCANTRVSAEINSLAATNPTIAKQWCHERNKGLTPEDVVAGSSVKVFWVCPIDPDHIWSTKVCYRTVREDGCPYCTNRKVDKSNCLSTVDPELTKEWNYDKNKELGLTPEDVTRGSGKRVWWQCKNNPKHTWQAQIFKRSQGLGLCPICKPRSNSPLLSAPRTENAAKAN